MEDPEPPDSDNKVSEIIEVSPYSDVKKFEEFELLMEDEPEKDIVVREKVDFEDLEVY
jgi:hypothetical protein